MLAISVLTSWTVDPLQLAPIALVGVAYGVRARTLHRRGQPVEGWRVAVFSLGLLLLVLAVASPLATVGDEELFSFHMAQHVLLGDLAPLCLLAGLNGPLLQPLLSVLPVRQLRRLSNPLVALPVWTANLLFWHLEPFFDTALEDGLVHFLEHASFFTAGVIMWLPVLETLPAPEWFGTGAKLAYIVVVRLVETLLGNVFLWSGSPFYDAYTGGEELLGLSPRADQAVAGSVMMLVGSLVTLTAIAWLFLRLAEEGEARQRLLEAGLDERTVNRAVRYRRWRELEPKA